MNFFLEEPAEVLQEFDHREKVSPIVKVQIDLPKDA
jgi:hypothetical protein